MICTERGDLKGTVLDGRYRIGTPIGVGGTGIVFSALRLDDERYVAIKVLRPSYVGHPDLGHRLRREAEVARAVDHPGIVPVLDEGTLPDGSPYIVMERVEGESLSRLLLRAGTLEVAESVALTMRVAAILHAVHREGYTHRDVKPEHVLLSSSAEGELVVRLLDFGVCASPTAPADERRRENGRVFGTPTYVSPEQASGNPNVDGRADVYGLGAMLFECLTGRVPFRASSVSALLMRIVSEDAPRCGAISSHIDLDLDAIVARCLARHVDDRFPSMRALARALVPHAGDRQAVERSLAAQVKPLRKAADDESTTMQDKPTVETIAA